MRFRSSFAFGLVLCALSVSAQQPDTSSGSRVLFNRRDLLTTTIAVGGVGLVTMFDDDIARASQRSRVIDPVTHEYTDDLSRWSTKISKVNETTLTVAGILAYGAGRLFKSPLVTDVALHATESVVLASLASQVIRGPLGRTRPYVTGDSDQYYFRPMKGFFGKSSFDNRAFPSIHTSSSMAVATVLVMETHRRHPGASYVLAPLAFGAGLLPGLARIKLDQHWTSDIVSGAFMGVFGAYKVVSFSHAHPNNRFDRMLLKASVVPVPGGGFGLSISPF
ncbi:MAG: phosphatase PAP2 family protein [Gemmatimonadota bacterium]